MDDIIFTIAIILMLISTFGLLVSIGMLLFKKWRKQGFENILIYTAVMVACPILVFLLTNKFPASDNIEVSNEETAVEKGVNTPLKNNNNQDAKISPQEKERIRLAKQQREAAEKEKARLIKQERIKQLAGFPDQATKIKAEAMNIKRYEAYRALTDIEVINQYCQYREQLHQSSIARNAQLDAASTKSKRIEINDAFDLAQDELTQAFTSFANITEWEILTLEQAGGWIDQCRAKARGWIVINEAEAKAISRKEANAARTAIHLSYLDLLEKNASGFFDSSRYKTAICNWENHKNLRLVGCRMRGWEGYSDWSVYVIGRSQQGHFAAAPINGLTVDHITLSGRSKGNILPIYMEEMVYLASYTFELDIDAAIAEFK